MRSSYDIRADPQRPSRPHIPELDGLRGIAILLVFVFHAFKANLLWMGVDLFFVLSGFLITGILLKDTGKSFRSYIGGFYSRRVRRIVPAYLVILVISAIIFGVGWLKYWYLYFGAMNLLVPFHLTYVKTLPLWSLAVEEQFYLLWPLAVFFLSRKHLSILAVSLVVLAPILRFVCSPFLPDGYGIYMLAPFRMDTLAVGALIAIYWPQIKERAASAQPFRKTIIRSSVVLLLIGLAGALVLNGAGFVPGSKSQIGSTALMESTLAIAAAMFVMALFGVGKRVLSSWTLVSLGRISYSFYLFHMTALYLVPGNNGFIAFPLALAYSAGMWYFVESPILNSGRKKIEQPDPLPAQEAAIQERIRLL